MSGLIIVGHSSRWNEHIYSANGTQWQCGRVQVRDLDSGQTNEIRAWIGKRGSKYTYAIKTYELYANVGPRADLQAVLKASGKRHEFKKYQVPNTGPLPLWDLDVILTRATRSGIRLTLEENETGR